MKSLSEIETTEIELNQPKFNKNLDDDLFYIAAEIMKLKNSRN